MHVLELFQRNTFWQKNPGHVGSEEAILTNPGLSLALVVRCKTAIHVIDRKFYRLCSHYCAIMAMLSYNYNKLTHNFLHCILWIPACIIAYFLCKRFSDDFLIFFWSIMQAGSGLLSSLLRTDGHSLKNKYMGRIQIPR